MTDMSPLVVDHCVLKLVSLCNNRIYTNHSKQYFYIVFQHLSHYRHIQLKIVSNATQKRSLQRHRDTPGVIF